MEIEKFTIKELQSKVLFLRTDIRNCIVKFEKETGIDVHSVGCFSEYQKEWCDDRNKKLYPVDVKLYNLY